MGVGRRLYHAGSPRGAVYESHTWRKGWPTVGHEVVSCTHCCVYEHGVVDLGVAYDKERMFAMHGHACRVLGLSSGLCRSGKRSPLHVRLSSMTWTRTCGVYSRARSPPTLTRDHLYVYADTGRPPRNISCSARSSPARTPALTLLGSSSELFPGSPVTHRPPHGCLRTPRPPCPGPIGGSMNLVGRRVWAWVAAVPWGGGRGAGCNGRAPGRPGGCPGAVAGWLLMDGGSWVVYYVRSPDHRRLFRK